MTNEEEKQWVVSNSSSVSILEMYVEIAGITTPTTVTLACYMNMALLL